MQITRKRAIDEVLKFWWDLEDRLRVEMYRAAQRAALPEDIAVYIIPGLGFGGIASIQQALMDLAVVLACSEVGVCDRSAFDDRMTVGLGVMDTRIAGLTHQAFGKVVRPNVPGAFTSRNSRRSRLWRSERIAMNPRYIDTETMDSVNHAWVYGQYVYY